MNPVLGRVFPGLEGRSLRAAAVVTVLGGLVGVIGGESVVLALVLALAGSLATLSLRGRRNPLAEEYGLLPAIAALGALAALATPSLLVGLLAGVAGLGLLLWNAESARDTVRTAEPVEGLLIPGLGLAIALLTALSLPTASAAVGAAAFAVVVALALVVWALQGALTADPYAAKAL
ncbi:MAG: hypothetical protein L3J80_01405 [Thermoplasmata archaeon]|nr:hypothetical protein [Thermoplasmata archaeon]